MCFKVFSFLFLLSFSSFVLTTFVEAKALTYSECKKDAFTRNSGQVKQIKKAIKLCRMNFPEAMFVADCKRKALKLRDRRKIARCKKISKHISKRRSASLPIVYSDGNLLIDRFVFRNSLPFSWLDENNFECSDLKNAVQDFNKASFIFFGEDLKESKGLQNAFNSKRKKIDSNLFEVERLFRVEGKRKQRVAYFPTGRCNVKLNKNKHINAISYFFLIDYQKKRLHPYTAVFFYNEFKPPKIRQVERDLRVRTFGSAGVRSKQRDKNYYARGKIKSFDVDGDPKNICKISGDLLAGIMHSLEKPGHTATAVVTNKKVFCNYRARLISQI